MIKHHPLHSRRHTGRISRLLHLRHSQRLRTRQRHHTARPCALPRRPQQLSHRRDSLRQGLGLDRPLSYWTKLSRPIRNQPNLTLSARNSCSLHHHRHNSTLPFPSDLLPAPPQAPCTNRAPATLPFALHHRA